MNNLDTIAKRITFLLEHPELGEAPIGVPFRKTMFRVSKSDYSNCFGTAGWIRGDYTFERPLFTDPDRFSRKLFENYRPTSLGTLIVFKNQGTSEYHHGGYQLDNEYMIHQPMEASRFEKKLIREYIKENSHSHNQLVSMNFELISTLPHKIEDKNLILL